MTAVYTGGERPKCIYHQIISYAMDTQQRRPQLSSLGFGRFPLSLVTQYA
jgi:hypothetical protein